MKRFRFGLEKLLELRVYREREAELVLAREMAELGGIQDRLRLLAEDRLAAAAERFAGGRSPAEMLNADRYILRLDRTKDQLLEAAAKAELKVETARAAFVEASRDKKVLEKLKDKRLGEYKKAAAAEEIKVLDDISGGAAARRGISLPAD